VAIMTQPSLPDFSDIQIPASDKTRL
jgi:hypothetical protein